MGDDSLLKTDAGTLSPVPCVTVAEVKRLRGEERLVRLCLHALNTTSIHAQSSSALISVKQLFFPRLRSVRWTRCAGAGAYIWDGELQTACNAAPGATVSPPLADPDGPQTGSALWDHRAGRPARSGHQVHLQVTVSPRIITHIVTWQYSAACRGKQGAVVLCT